jgi:hypothetical protein
MNLKDCFAGRFRHPCLPRHLYMAQASFSTDSRSHLLPVHRARNDEIYLLSRDTFTAGNVQRSRTRDTVCYAEPNFEIGSSQAGNKQAKHLHELQRGRMRDTFDPRFCKGLTKNDRDAPLHSHTTCHRQVWLTFDSPALHSSKALLCPAPSKVCNFNWAIQ